MAWIPDAGTFFGPDFTLNITDWREYQDTYIYYKAPVNSSIHNRLLYGAGGVERYWVRGFDPYYIVDSGVLKFAASPGIAVHTWTALVYETHDRVPLGTGITIKVAGPGLPTPLFREGFYYVGIRYEHGVIGDLPDALPTVSTWAAYESTAAIPGDFFHLFTLRVKPGTGAIVTADIELIDHRADNCAKITVDGATKIIIKETEREIGFEIDDGEHGPYYIRPDDDGLHFEDEDGNHIDLHCRDLWCEYIHCYGVFATQDPNNPQRHGKSGFVTTSNFIHTMGTIEVGGTHNSSTGVISNSKIQLNGVSGHMTATGNANITGIVAGAKYSITGATGNISTQGTISATGNITTSGNIVATGTITGSKVYNAVYNDVAETFKFSNKYKKEDLIEKIIEFDSSGELIPASKNSKNHEGVVSTHETIAILMGEESEDRLPVALAGSVWVKAEGVANVNDIGLRLKSGDMGFGIPIPSFDKNISPFEVVGRIIDVDVKVNKYKIKLK